MISATAGLSLALLVLAWTGVSPRAAVQKNDPERLPRAFTGGNRSPGSLARTGAVAHRAQRAVRDRSRTAADADHARLHEFLDPKGFEHPDQREELVPVAGGLDRDRVR